MKQHELFADYELDHSKWYSVIIKILGGSLALHLILFLAAVYIPAVRDTFYVLQLFSGAPTGWAKADYNKTGVEEEVTIINVPRSDRFEYPAGYFGSGDAMLPTDPATTDLTALSGDYGFVPPQPVPTPFGLATPFPTPFVPTPYVPPVVNTPPARRGGAGGGLPKLPNVKKGAKPPPLTQVPGNAEASATPTPKPVEVAQAKPSPSPSVNPADENKLNQKPLLDLADKTIAAIKTKQIDLNQPVAVTIRGTLDQDGKFVAPPKYTVQGGDPKLAAMASEMIAALSDSNMLRYVKALSEGSTRRDVVFNIGKNEKQVTIQMLADVGNEDNAKKVASGLNLAFFALKQAKKGSEEGEMLERIVLTNDKNQVVINWEMDTSEAMKKLEKKLADLPKQQPSSQNVNSNAQSATK